MPEQVLVEPALVGEWAERPDGPFQWRVQQEGDDAYVIDAPMDASEGSPCLHAVGRLFEFRGARFLDVGTATIPESEAGRLFPFPTIAGHTLLWIEVRGDTLVWSDLDEDWWASRLKEEPNALRHEVIGPDSYNDDAVIVLTATTKELQAFIVKEMRRQPESWHEMFSERTTYVRK